MDMETAIETKRSGAARRPRAKAGLARWGRWLLPALALVIAACSPRALPPGHEGPVPSPGAQRVLAELAGSAVAIPSFGAGEWQIQGFAVIPYEPGRKGPVVRVTRDSEQRYLPVETDGDVGDLYRRVRGTAPAELGTKQSERYAAVWE